MCLINTGILRQIINRATEWCHRIQSQFFLQSPCKNFCHLIIAVCDKNFCRFFFKCFDPGHQAIDIRMTADSRHLTDLRTDRNRLTEQFDLCRTLQKCPAKCSDCLISHKQNRIIRIPQVMFQMMFDSTGITHTTSRNNNLAVFIRIDSAGIVTGNGRLQSRKHQRVNALSDQCHCLFIKTVINMFIENRCCFICQRTVDINLKVVVAMHASFFFYLADKIQHLLCTADCEGRNDHISATVKGSLDHFGKD